MILFPCEDHSNPCFRPFDELTEEVREECYQWFEQHMDELPKHIKLGDGIEIDDVPFTVRNMIQQLRFVKWERNKVYRGNFAFLRWIQEKCKEQMAAERPE